MRVVRVVRVVVRSGGGGGGVVVVVSFVVIIFVLGEDGLVGDKLEGKVEARWEGGVCDGCAWFNLGSLP